MKNNKKAKPAGSAGREKTQPTKEVSDKQLDSLLSSLQEKFGEGSIMRLGEVSKVDVAVVPTGSFSLDLALGVGGLPRGRVIEIFGPESSGKTTLALNVVAQAQKMGGKAAFIDAEHAMDPEYAAKLGVNVNELLISQPDSGEEALNILESLVRSGMISVVVVDSVAALTPKAELEGEMGEQHVGRQARMMGQALRKLTAIAITDTDDGYFHQPAPHEDWRDVRQSRNDAGRTGAPLRRIGSHRYPPHRAGKKRRKYYRQPRESESGKKQSCARRSNSRNLIFSSAREFPTKATS